MSITELDSRASVNDLIVHNPADVAVLLYEGEEVLGAQQNRTFDVSVLVAPQTKLSVPVSCVEAGRWDSGRHAEAFSAAPQAAYPALRRVKNQQAGAAAAAGRRPRADQQAVWDEVAHKSATLSVDSATGLMHDVFERHRERLHALRARIEPHPDQVGALVAIGGRFDVLDHVSRADVFAALHGPLVEGYALDALGAPDADAPSLEAAGRFLELLQSAPVTEHDGIGLGRDLRFAHAEVAGAGLVSGTELVQLTAFAEAADNPHRPWPLAGRIRRSSRRRP